MPILKLLGFINALPNTIVGALILLPLMAFKQVRAGDFKQWRATAKNMMPWCIFLEVTPGSWLDNRSWWWGWTVGAFVVIREMDEQIERGYIQTTIRHERIHILQQNVAGILMPITYFLISVGMYFFNPNKHPYYNNPYEIYARKGAGQTVDITKEMWQEYNIKTGKDISDRWPWW